MIICLSTALYRKTTLARSFAYNIAGNIFALVLTLLLTPSRRATVVFDASKMQKAHDQCDDFPALPCKRSTHPASARPIKEKGIEQRFDKKL
jgi:hypothetical protein